MDAIVDKIPNFAIKAFAAIGFVFLGSKVISYIRLLLSLFVLSGKNVSTTNTGNCSNSMLMMRNS
jgi:17beta-estradiol 17-dehydrogenase / very-long-chain 3-oxoacyl-CoA reductase